MREIWNWQRCQDRIRSLRGRLGFPDTDSLRFLKLGLSLTDGSIYDELKRKLFEGSEVAAYFLLSGYANAKYVPETSRLISFTQLSGGPAYYKAFTRRAVQPLAEHFGSKALRFLEAAELLEGVRQSHGEYSVKIFALPLVPLTIILWAKTVEFPASGNILFDSNANSYLSTEELATLSGLTLQRLRDASEILEK